jgi:hypothetical protein
VTDVDKHSSLIQQGVNYARKELYHTGHSMAITGEKLFNIMFYNFVMTKKTFLK